MDWQEILEGVKQFAIDNGPLLLAAIAILLITKPVGRMISGLTARGMRRSAIDPIIIEFTRKVIHIVVFFAMVWWALGVLGVDRTSALAILGAAGLAVGLALQGTLSNLAAGIMIVFRRPFQTGDLVTVMDKTGIVESIDFFSTHIDTVDNRHVIIPNAHVVDHVIENFSHNPVRRVDVSVGTDYSADLRSVRSVLENAISSIPGAVGDPAPEVFLKSLGDSSIDWEARVWCKPEDYWPVWQAVTNAVKVALDDSGISIPFPQMDVHLDRINE